MSNTNRETEMTRKLGDDAHVLGRYVDTRVADEQKLAEILMETGGVAPPPADETLRHELTKPGDPRKLRGIPCIARGVPGRSGQDPFLAVQHWPER